MAAKNRGGAGWGGQFMITGYIKNTRRNHEEITIVEVTLYPTEIQIENDALREYVNNTFGYCTTCANLFFKDDLTELDTVDGLVRYLCLDCLQEK